MNLRSTYSGPVTPYGLRMAANAARSAHRDYGVSVEFMPNGGIISVDCQGLRAIAQTGPLPSRLDIILSGGIDDPLPDVLDEVTERLSRKAPRK